MGDKKDLPPEIKREMLQTHFDTLRQIISERFNILSVISGLAATLLVIATFNENLLEITIFVKIILAILLAIMPISLILKLIDIHMGETATFKSIGEITGCDYKQLIKNGRRQRGKLVEIINPILAWSSYVILGIFTVLVIIIIILLWSSPTPVPSVIPAPSHTPTPSPSLSPTPIPTPTPTPTSTPTSLLY